MELGQIEKLTKHYADGRDSLGNIVRSMEEELEEVKRRYIPRIKKVVGLVAERQAALKNAIEESADLFVKPRTIVIHGIKIGYQKAKGEITWDDTDQVLRLIHKHFPDLADILIKTTETPIKKGLAQLGVADLKKIGVNVVETGDEIVIKSTDSEVDKLVNALLKEEKETVEAAS